MLSRRLDIKELLFKILPVAVPLAVVYILGGNYSFILLVIPLLYYGKRYLNDDLILFLAFFSVLGFSSDIGDALRSIFNALSILILAGYAVISAKKNAWKIKELPIVLLIFFIFDILLMLASSTASEFFSVGIAETGRQSLFFFLLFLIYQIYNDFESFQKIIDYLIIISAFVAFTIAIGFFSTIDSFEKLVTEVLVKEGGLFSNVAAPGGLIGTSIVLLNYRMLTNTSALLNKAWLLKVFMVVMVVGLFLTNSRAAILTAVSGTIIIQLALNFKRFLKYSAITVLVLGSAVLISLSFFDIFNLYFRTDRILENTRYVLWELTWSMISDNLAFGTGPGGAKYMWTRYTNVLFGTWTGDQVAWVYNKGGSGHSHNFLLFRWSELGIFGMLSAVWMYIYFPAVIILNTMKYKWNKEVRDLNFAFLAVILGLFVRSGLEATGILTNGWVSRDLPFWLIILMAMHFRVQKQVESPESLGTDIK